MNLGTALKLGRVSNLPTVWSNTLVGLALSVPAFGWHMALAACCTFSLFYLAGMFLNDAFDAEWDRQQRKQRPIPLGEASKTRVIYFAIAFLMMAMLLVLLASRQPVYSFMLAFILLSSILLYDWKHKQWPNISPWLMGACRFTLYFCAASFVGPLPWSLAPWLVAASMLLYIAGITALARGEHEDRVVSRLMPLLMLFAPCSVALLLGYNSAQAILVTLFAFAWIIRALLQIQSAKSGCVSRSVAALLAGIAVIDAAFLFALQASVAGFICVGAFVLCLVLQKRIAAT